MKDAKKTSIRERQRKRSEVFRKEQLELGRKPTTAYFDAVVRNDLKVRAGQDGWPKTIPGCVEQIVCEHFGRPYSINAKKSIESESDKISRKKGAKPTPRKSPYKPSEHIVALPAQTFEQFVKNIQRLISFCSKESKRLYYYKGKISRKLGNDVARKERRHSVPKNVYQDILEEVSFKCKENVSVTDLETQYRAKLSSYAQMLQEDLRKTQSELENLGAKAKHFFS